MENQPILSIEEMEIEINKVLFSKLGKGFYTNTWIGKNAFQNNNYIGIQFACSSININDVKDQKPQMNSLKLEYPSMEFSTQIFCGMGGRSIYRKPDLNNNDEKYLAMKSVKIPFRTPQPRFEKNN